MVIPESMLPSPVHHPLYFLSAAPEMGESPPHNYHLSQLGLCESEDQDGSASRAARIGGGCPSFRAPPIPPCLLGVGESSW